MRPWTTRHAGTSRSRPNSPRSASPCPARSPAAPPAASGPAATATPARLSCTAPIPPGPAKPAPAPSPRPSLLKTPSGYAPTLPLTAACASSSPNSKPSPSNSPNGPQHPKRREISALKPGPAPGEHPITADQQGSVVGPPLPCAARWDGHTAADPTAALEDEASMRGRMAGAARRAHARSRAASLVIAAAAVPALVAGQSVGASAATAAPATPNVALQPMTPALSAQLSANVNQHVIVIMKGQLASARVGTQASAMRSDAIAAQQAPLMSELSAVHATHVKSYRLVNSLAATVSTGEEARLKANAQVAEVIPDVTIHGAQPTQAAALGSVTKTSKKAAAKANASTSLTPNVIPGACSSGRPQLDPEGLALTNTDSTDPHAKTARSLGITGAGVKVAWIADGVDPGNINFL